MRKKFGLDSGEGPGSASASPTKPDGTPKAKRGRPPKSKETVPENNDTPSPSPKKKSKANLASAAVVSKPESEVVCSDGSESPTCRVNFLQDAGFDSEDKAGLTPRKPIRLGTSDEGTSGED